MKLFAVMKMFTGIATSIFARTLPKSFIYFCVLGLTLGANQEEEFILCCLPTAEMLTAFIPMMGNSHFRAMTSDLQNVTDPSAGSRIEQDVQGQNVEALLVRKIITKCLRTCMERRYLRRIKQKYPMKKKTMK